MKRKSIKNSTTESYIKSIIKAIMLIYVCLILYVPAITAQSNEGWSASGKLIEKLSIATPRFNYQEEKVPVYILPDPLILKNGTVVSQKDGWTKHRRPEVLELFTTQVYGRVPATRYKKTIKVLQNDPNAMNGEATMKLVDITFEANSKSLTIHLGLFIPNKLSKPAPAFLLICNRPPDNIDFTRQKKTEFWPAEEIIARGYVAAAFYNGDVDADNFDNFQNGIHGLLDTQRTGESWGTLSAWAWGASRCMDYLVTDKNIDPDKIAVVGHSRGGKTALWAAATDKRFAMAVSNEAGCGGSSLSRRKFGETIDRINSSFPHWFCENYKKFSNKEDLLPVDQHMLLALIAPRALYVASADEDLWGDPKGQYLALYHAMPVYQLFNSATVLPKTMPPLNTPVYNGNVAYHIREGAHNLNLKDWGYFMDYADLVLKKYK